MYGYGLMWVIVIAANVGFWTIFVIFRRMTVKADSKAVFEASSKADTRLSKLGFERFDKIYMRVEGPRGAIYAGTAFLTALLIMPAAFLASDWIFNSFWNATGRDETLDIGLAPWLFFMTLLMIGFWVAVAAIFAHFYHRNKPGSLDRELDKELYST